MPRGPHSRRNAAHVWFERMRLAALVAVALGCLAGCLATLLAGAALLGGVARVAVLLDAAVFGRAAVAQVLLARAAEALAAQGRRNRVAAGQLSHGRACGGLGLLLRLLL